MRSKAKALALKKFSEDSSWRKSARDFHILNRKLCCSIKPVCVENDVHEAKDDDMFFNHYEFQVHNELIISLMKNPHDDVHTASRISEKQSLEFALKIDGSTTRCAVHGSCNTKIKKINVSVTINNEMNLTKRKRHCLTALLACVALILESVKLLHFLHFIIYGFKTFLISLRNHVRNSLHVYPAIRVFHLSI